MFVTESKKEQKEVENLYAKIINKFYEQKSSNN